MCEVLFANFGCQVEKSLTGQTCEMRIIKFLLIRKVYIYVSYVCRLDIQRNQLDLDVAYDN